MTGLAQLGLAVARLALATRDPERRRAGAVGAGAVGAGLVALVDWRLPGTGAAGALVAAGVVVAPVVVVAGAALAVRMFRSAGLLAFPVDQPEPDRAERGEAA